MLADGHLLRGRQISPEANNLLHFYPELRVPEISACILQLHSIFDNPRVKSMAAELWGMASAYQRMLTGLDPIAWRRKQLEYFRGLDEASAFNDLSGQLPLPSPPPRSHISDFPQNPPRENRLYCAPILGIPAPVMMIPPELTDVQNKWWCMDDLQLWGAQRA